MAPSTAAAINKVDPSIADLPRPELHEETVYDLFAQLTNEDDRSYNLSVETWHVASFTSPGLNEAVIRIFDGNQSRAAGMNELWLLRFDEDWRVAYKIAEAVLVYFQAVDVDADGVDELQIIKIHGNHGYDHISGEVVSLRDAQYRTLFTYSGHNFRGAGVPCEEGYMEVYHKLEFRDLDGDGLLEILNTQIRSYISPESQGRPRELTYEESMTFYKLTGGTYLPVSEDESWEI